MSDTQDLSEQRAGKSCDDTCPLFVQPVVEEGLLPFLVEYARKLQSRPPDFSKAIMDFTEDLARQSSIECILIGFWR
jgi:hypothetical protein